MIELPEASNLAIQMAERLKGREIKYAVANYSPHKFCWYYGEPEEYRDILIGKTVGECHYFGGHVEMRIGDLRLNFHDGATPRLYNNGDKRPTKHQLLIEFADDASLVFTVRMYAGIFLMPSDSGDNEYIKVAKERPDPYNDRFDLKYFLSLTEYNGFSKDSVKAFLATQQRIPGLGNGVLQDILWNAEIHPKRKMEDLSQSDLERLYDSVKKTLFEMKIRGGRDTERDLIGEKGGYKTILSKNTHESPCPRCGQSIERKAYLGGNIYYCPKCQKY